MNRTKILAAALALIACNGFMRAEEPKPPVGDLGAVTFTNRSPLSETKAIATRLKLPAAPTDNYNLAEHPFLVFVPEAYDTAKPMGLLVLENYKASDGLPEAILPQLEEANMAFVVSKDWPDEWWVRAGLALDAVHNLQQQYRIDPRRIYVMGGGSMAPVTEPGVLAQRLGLFFPDVFSGTIAMDMLFYRKTPTADGKSMWNARMLKPDARFMTLAKSRPVIFAPQQDSASWQALVKAYKTDGFQHVDFRTLTRDQIHYPMYTNDWLPEMIRFLDAATKDLAMPAAPPTKPATKPTTKPSAPPRAATRPAPH